MNGLLGLLWGFDQKVYLGVARTAQAVLGCQCSFEVDGVGGIKEYVDVAASAVVIRPGTKQINAAMRVQRPKCGANGAEFS